MSGWVLNLALILSICLTETLTLPLVTRMFGQGQAVVIDGHPLLRDAALRAARQWEFTPTEFSGKLVKVIGILTFNFSLK